MSQARPLLPVDVVVDSRNVWGSSSAMFGPGRRVEVAGIVKAMRQYGFEARRVFVAIATESASAHRSARLSDSLRVNAEYAASVVRHPAGSVLHGRLVERNGVQEEKLVDVLCAMRIAESAHEIQSRASGSRGIVVMSEDMDLIPAYQFAQRLRVPIYAASHQTVDTRDSSDWLLLTESAMREICGRLPGRYAGSALRRQMVSMARNVPAARLSFTVRAFDRKSGAIFCAHNSGAWGVYSAHPSRLGKVSRGDKLELWVKSLQCDEKRGFFPAFELVDQAPSRSAMRNLIEVVVVRWKTPNRVEVRFPDGSVRTLTAPIASMLPGTSAMVEEYVANGRQPAWRFVGSTSSEPSHVGWTDCTQPQIARVVSNAGSPGARVSATLVDSDQVVSLQPPGRDAPKVGDEYAVVPVGHMGTSDGPQVLVVCVSARLARAVQ